MKTPIIKSSISYIILVGIMGMTLGLIGNEIKSIPSWSDLFSPSFVGTTFIHIGTVIGAYLTGKFTPAARNEETRTRSTNR